LSRAYLALETGAEEGRHVREPAEQRIAED
jgi:hypothetical protein